ncbi:MAG: MAPEG family protein [Maricaulaceae bacterium]
MPVEALMVLASLALWFIQVVILAVPGVLKNGVMAAFGSRDNFAAPIGPLVGRAERSKANLLENLVLFIPIALLVLALDASNATTALGAQVFVIARVVHMLCYLAGVPFVRSLAWIASLVGVGMMIAGLLG